MSVLNVLRRSSQTLACQQVHGDTEDTTADALQTEFSRYEVKWILLAVEVLPEITGHFYLVYIA